jgi:hypothetical protein
VINEKDVCDGADLGGQDCISQGFVFGALACSNTCDAFDTSGCVLAWFSEDFEKGSPLSAYWAFGGNQPWVASQVTPQEGAWNSKSGLITHSQNSHMEVTLNFPIAGNISFWRRVSSETNWDFLRFFIDGVQQTQWSGNLPWAQQNYPVAAGQHTFRWQYIKDNSVSSFEDAGYIDAIVTVGGVLP